MDNTTSYLITLSNGLYLLRAAIKVRSDMLTGDAAEAALEPENKQQFKKLLPLHVQTFGEIVEVEEIFELKDHTK